MGAREKKNSQRKNPPARRVSAQRTRITARVVAFTEELRALCSKYAVEITHEDEHGSFILVLQDKRGAVEHYWSPP